MSVRDFSVMPYSGLPASEVIAALQCVAENAELCSKPIIAVAVRDDGKAMVTMGEKRGPLSGGGVYVILTKTPDGWRQSGDIGGWAS